MPKPGLLENISSLLGLDAGIAADFLPARDLAADVLAELLRRRRRGLGAVLRELLLDFRGAEDLEHLAVQALHHVARRRGRNDDALPRADVETLEAKLGDRGQLGRDRR